ncbi:hypothetical protein CJP72_17055 [Citrobacter sp. NCU1]|uniref:YiaA/YiaB family inner membrane protein n=1 Tax=Citrobacter sp. NCU1 TaxID=2026683 RepID=UPI001390CC70|nr:YiaA/YiaB family inner membrane protein [Citrobacter sp. NCU1]NDO82422.1 hypothetical protein [Citrobacter sp. NCU1]
MDDNIVRRKRAVGLLMLVSGALVYLAGLWPVCQTLYQKGYFLGVIVMMGFPVLIHYEQTGGERLLGYCKYLLLFSSGMLLIGVWNIELPSVMKVTCLLAAGICLSGADMYASNCESK